MGQDQQELLSQGDEVDLTRVLLADLHDDLRGKLARFRQLNDLCLSLGPSGTMLFGGPNSSTAWGEARSSFVHGNFSATIILCQGLVEHLLAAFTSFGSLEAIQGPALPKRIKFAKTLDLCLEKGVLTERDVADLRRLMQLRNPLSHYRHADDDESLMRRAMETRVSPEEILRRDASFAIALAVRIMGLEPFRVG